MIGELYPKVNLYRRLVQAKLFIDRNYSSKLDVDNISDEAYFSKFHFIRLFKQTYGKTPHQYLISVRIEKAVQLLRANKPVSEVCHAVGFESLSSFSGLFKKLIGTTPSAYATKHEALKREIAVAPFKFIPSCYVHQNGWSEQ